MSWPNFLDPRWGFLGLIAIPIILLYILRQKRPDLPISSTLLWSKTLADMRASTPFQKLRRNLLLLLQLLILAALVFTLMRPVIQATASQRSAGVIVIDATASMQTRDGGADETRLDAAKAEAKKLVDGMRPGDKFMLIADGGGMNQVRSGFSSSKSELRSLIDSIKPSDVGSDLSESLLLAATSLRAIGAEAAPGAPKTDALTAGSIWLFSDGAGVKVPDAMGENNGALRFVKIGSSDHSVGITRLSITPVPKEPRTYQVFVGLKNAWSVEKKIGVALAYGTKENILPDQAQFVTLPANGSGTVVFEKVIADPGKLYVLADDKDDDFPLDNVGYGILSPARKVRVTLVTQGSELFEGILKTAAKVGKIELQIVAPSAYKPTMESDLFVFDSFLPAADQMPRADTLLVRPQVTAAGDVGGFKVEHVIETPVVLRWKREDPLMQFVELGDLRISKALLMDKDPNVVELVSSPEGPLIAYRDVGSSRRYFIAFSPMLESNWWRIPSLLIFMQNAIEQTRERHFIGMPQLMVAGTPATLWDVGDAKGEGQVPVKLPDGTAGTIAAKEGAAEFGETDHVGYYEYVSHGEAGATGSRSSLFAVNLLNGAESDIRPSSLQTVSGGNVAEAAGVASVNKEIWRWLALAAVAVLMLEWWIYHRRIA